MYPLVRATYRVDGMTCGGCVKSVVAKLSTVASDVEVTLSPPQARLSAAADLTVTKLNELMGGKYTFTALPADSIPARTASEGPERVVDVMLGEGRGDVAPYLRPEGVPAEVPKTWFETYQPLLLIAGYIALASFAGTTALGRAGFDWSVWMTNAMAGFFLVFSAFKFLNLKGFAEAYATYDLGAKAWAPWGYVYPFLELLLGCAYLFRWNLPLTNLATIVLMGFSSLGVIQALSKKQTIRCACLGTVLNVPMSTITLVEDLAMVAMATLALLGGH
jgi:copper chaperone CopZ